MSPEAAGQVIGGLLVMTIGVWWALKKGCGKVAWQDMAIAMIGMLVIGFVAWFLARL